MTFAVKMALNPNTTNQQILDSSKLNEFAGINFKFDEIGRKVLQKCRKDDGKNEKLRNTSDF